MMQATANKITNYQQENQLQNGKGAEVLNLEEQREVMEVRKKLASLILDSNWQKFQSSESRERSIKYLEAQQGTVPKKAAANSTTVPHADSLEELLGVYEYMSKEWKAAEQRLERIKSSIKAAISEKLASPADMDFLVNNLILNGEYDLNEANSRRFEEIIKGKIERMRKDKKWYKTLSENKFAKDPAITQIEAREKINLKDPEAFLKSPVPKRREFLEKVDEKMTELELQEAHGERNLKKMKELYLKRLEGKLSKTPGTGSIGQRTVAILEKRVEGLDLEGLKKLSDRFNGEIAVREEFCKEFRSTLKGAALAHMEERMHKLSFLDFQKEFEIVKEAESKRLIKDYASAIQKYKAEQLFGKHTEDEFMAWFSIQPLEVQYGAQASLESWQAMGQYRELWQEASSLTDEQQKFMRKQLKNLAWGYSEFKAQLDEFKTENEGGSKKSVSTGILSNIQNLSVRKAAEDINDTLSKKTDGDRRKFIKLLERQGRSNLRVINFDEKVQEEVKEKMEKEDADIEIESLDNDQRLGLLERDKETNVTDWKEFEQIEMADGDEATHVVASETNGLNKLLAEYNDSDQEALSTTISVYDAGYQEIDLNKKEAANIALYLKEEMKSKSEVGKGA